jgi:hypothetical protein
VRDIVRIPEASKPDKSCSLLLSVSFSGDWAQHAPSQARPAVLGVASRNSEIELLEDLLRDDVYLSEGRAMRVPPRRFAIPAEVAG